MICHTRDLRQKKWPIKTEIQQHKDEKTTTPTATTARTKSSKMQCNTKRDFAIKIKYFKMNNMPQSVADK